MFTDYCFSGSATGYRLLAIGYRLLAIGYWPSRSLVPLFPAFPIPDP
jgi:hypothetical protein